jgi:hypothetical protein
MCAPPCLRDRVPLICPGTQDRTKISNRKRSERGKDALVALGKGRFAAAIWPDRQLPCREIGIGTRGGRITELLFGKVSREFPNYTLECCRRQSAAIFVCEAGSLIFSLTI